MVKLYDTALYAPIVVVLTTSLSAHAQSEGEEQAGNRFLYIIIDGSNSMWGELADKSRKISAAKDVFNNLDPALLAERDVTLRLYVHRRAGDFSDTELVVPFGPASNSINKISLT